MKNMWYILIIVFTISLGTSFARSIPPYHSVTVAELKATPEEFLDMRVEVTGYFSRMGSAKASKLGNAVCYSKEMAMAGNEAGCVPIVTLPRQIYSDPRLTDGTEVRVIGWYLLGVGITNVGSVFLADCTGGYPRCYIQN